ncbi:MAG TPA: hypothetical protein VLA14_15565, partial [Polyangia bacterium]|nr:hypothetical protein [Polyangia bacterium]
MGVEDHALAVVERAHFGLDSHALEDLSQNLGCGFALLSERDVLDGHARVSFGFGASVFWVLARG